MRTPDDPNREPFRGLGEKVASKAAPAPPPLPPKPRGDYGIVADPETGRLRTTKDNKP